MTATPDAPRDPHPSPGERAGEGAGGGAGSGSSRAGASGPEPASQQSARQDSARQGSSGRGAARSGVLGFTDSLGRALDGLAGTPAWALTPDQQAEALVALRREQARLVELELRILAAADRNEVGTQTGATSTAAWLAHQTAATTRSVAADVHLARALDTDFETTREALAAGVIDAAKARVVVHAVQALTDEHDDLPPGTQARAEAHLVDLAGDYDLPTLRRFGKRLFEVVCPEAADLVEGRRLAAEEARARRVAHLSMRENGDGTVEGRFRLPSLHAAVLTKALQALTSPRRLGEGRVDPETGRKLSQATLFGRGFMELLETHLNLTTLPSAHGSPFTIVVTIPWQTLQDGLGVATLESGQRLSAGEARRLCCKAGIVPMVLDGDSMPIDVGRKKRCYDFYQKLVIDHRHQKHGGCASITATGHRRSASTTTPTPGPRAAAPTPRPASRCAHRTTRWPTTPRPGT